MRIVTWAGKTYMLVKLNAADSKLLRELNRTEPARKMRFIDAIFNRFVANAVPYIFIRHYGMCLVESGKLTKRAYNSALDKIDRALERFNAVITKHTMVFGYLDFGETFVPRKTRARRH